MIFMRYQHRRQEAEDGGGPRENSGHEMKRKMNVINLTGESLRAVARETLISTFVCGTLLLFLGISILCVGLFVPSFKRDPTSCFVVGPTFIVLGTLVLLLSLGIILKLRKISSSIRSSAELESLAKKGKENQKNISEKDNNDEEIAAKDSTAKAIPVVIHPATPLQQLDTKPLAVDVVEHR
ncbi:uncharacterized protein LOC118205949 [Stegodyphus dumicola]|uniref:uncharacterized protein LOC118205949 n=1 Tax=Stegodyphus dumicola TaxID=202533 RepID=UPI0015A7C2D2|nr:uncharacterized protein LOC118205949 [Stegodyphus dumicola]